MSATQFLDQPFKVANDCSCPICFENKGPSQRSYFVVHEGENGYLHPMHRECIQRWILDNPTCPVCRIPVKDTSSLFTKVTRLAWRIQYGAQAGMNAVSDIQLLGALATTVCVFVILFGESPTRDLLTLSGTSYSMANLAGIYISVTELGSRVDAQIQEIAPATAIFGVLWSVVPYFLRMTQKAHFFQAMSIYALAKSAGWIHTVKSATIGVATQLVLDALDFEFCKQFSPVVSGGMGIFVGGLDSDWMLNALPFFTGTCISYWAYEKHRPLIAAAWAYEKHRPLIAAAMGSCISGITQSIFRKAYGDRRPAD